jgi:hypothetical protein
MPPPKPRARPLAWLPSARRARHLSRRLRGNRQALYRFGRNPDGSPAEPWGWEDLD